MPEPTLPGTARPGTLLAFDFGLKQIGVACGQSVTGTSSGLTILSAKDGVPDWKQVEKLLQEWRPDLVLVGLPLNMDDTESALSTRARRFARSVAGRFNYPVKMIDERLSSREAKEIYSATHNRGRTHLDDIAAALILATWFQQPELATEP